MILPFTGTNWELVMKWQYVQMNNKPRCFTEHVASALLPTSAPHPDEGHTRAWPYLLQRSATLGASHLHPRSQRPRTHPLQNILEPNRHQTRPITHHPCRLSIPRQANH